MRQPAVTIAAAFACGIVLGLHPAVARNASSHTLLSSFFVFIAVLVLAGIILVRFDRLFPATAPGGKTLLIDGGGVFGGFPGHEEHNGVDPGEEAVSPYLWLRGFQRLDVVALTHAHQDHLRRAYRNPGQFPRCEALDRA